jgi:hypothetical protein
MRTSCIVEVSVELAQREGFGADGIVADARGTVSLASRIWITSPSLRRVRTSARARR